MYLPKPWRTSRRRYPQNAPSSLSLGFQPPPATPSIFRQHDPDGMQDNAQRWLRVPRILMSLLELNRASCLQISTANLHAPDWSRPVTEPSTTQHPIIPAPSPSGCGKSASLKLSADRLIPFAHAQDVAPTGLRQVSSVPTALSTSISVSTIIPALVTMGRPPNLDLGRRQHIHVRNASLLFNLSVVFPAGRRVFDHEPISRRSSLPRLVSRSLVHTTGTVRKHLLLPVRVLPGQEW